MTSSVRRWIKTSPPVELITEWTSTACKDIVLGALRQGPVPQHMAFVMDGNRRFARNRRKEVAEGHSAGFEALARTLEICYKIGVKVVTVYAFSIENFKRSQYEVNNLQDMAMLRLTQFAAHGQILDRYGARIRLLGRRELVRPDLLEAIDEAMEKTKHNNKAVLNICAPYTSRDEMATAVQKTVAEFCEPIQPKLRRPFSESHIARNIQAHRTESATSSASKTDEAHDISPERSDQSLLPDDEDYLYRPSKPATSKAYVDFLQRIKDLLNGAADEHTATADDSVITGASASILLHLKDARLSREDKLAEVSDILDSRMTLTQIDELQRIADLLSDWSPHTIPSSETTLNNAGSNGRSTPTPLVLYPDAERICEETITAHTLVGSDAPPLDILVRTSGVERLSDFLLWQAHEDTDIAFVDCYWPDFGLWHFLPLLLEWQHKQRKKATSDIDVKDMLHA